MSKYSDLVTKLKSADKETIGLIAELLAILAEPDDNNNPTPKKEKKASLDEMSSKERAALILEGVKETPKHSYGPPTSHGTSQTYGQPTTMTGHASMLL